jgi:hypothetical protein
LILCSVDGGDACELPICLPEGSPLVDIMSHEIPDAITCDIVCQNGGTLSTWFSNSDRRGSFVRSEC